MVIKMEEKGNKVYIYVKDEDNEIENVEWTVIVDKAEFEWCIYKKQEAGFVDLVTFFLHLYHSSSPLSG